MKKETVFVGMSGGVDSSVSALRLKRAGYNVVGVFIKTWSPGSLHCTIEEDRLDAMRVAAVLDIPFKTFDATDAYKKGVADYMIAEYKAGRTPNPDVMCNRHVKFGVFLEYAKKEGASYVATGHYAQVQKEGELFKLSRGIDPEKDQTYFLWTLTPDDLKHILFPVGDTVKSEIRTEAEKYSLPTWAKNDSQGICFLGQVDIKEFLSHYVAVAHGDVLDEEGTIIGSHDGALFFTYGQRHGFTITKPDSDKRPYYVIKKDIAQNTITVGKEAPQIGTHRIRLESVNTIGRTIPSTCEAQIRYRQKPCTVTTEYIENGHAMMVSILDKSSELPAPGQSMVFYEGNECLGGEIVSTIV